MDTGCWRFAYVGIHVSQPPRFSPCSSTSGVTREERRTFGVVGIKGIALYAHMCIIEDPDGSYVG